MSDINIKVKRVLFSFSSEQDWINKARSRYANCGVPKGYYITVDALGRVMHMGKCFKAATEQGAYPVTVYELATNWEVTANPDASKQLGEGVSDQSANSDASINGIKGEEKVSNFFGHNLAPEKNNGAKLSPPTSDALPAEFHSVEFKFVDFNVRRAERGVEAARVSVKQDGEESLLWMSLRDINLNIIEFGENPELIAAREAYWKGGAA